MKNLLLAALLLSSGSAFAFSPDQVVKSLNDKTVRETLDGKILTSITDGPSARCAGCFGLVIKTLEDGAYRLNGMEFAGRFNVTIGKID